MQHFFIWLWRLAPPVLLLVLAAGMLWFPQFLSELVEKLSPGCVFRRITGLACPGCGSTRAIRAFIEGDIGGAICCNPFLFASLPLLLAEYIRSWRHFFFPDTAALPRSRAYCIILLLYAVLTIAWGIARNFL